MHSFVTYFIQHHISEIALDWCVQFCTLILYSIFL